MKIGKTRLCRNNCVFCFVDQLPPGCRASLLEKDDDWRMSLLFGNYVTFTNVPERQIKKIIRRKYSPLYISVHAADAKIRQRLLRCKSGLPNIDIMPLLRRFKENGIIVHGQIVVCPGINDGEVLSETTEALHGLIRSLAIVPVGLTKFQKSGLLKPVTADIAARILKTVGQFQDRFLRLGGTRFVWCADEFYLLAGRDLPDYDFYENFAQIDNGVGMIAQFKREFVTALNDEAGQCPATDARRIAIDIATGVSAFTFITELCGMFTQKFPNYQINIHKIFNGHFGESVTVTGLTAGSDIVAQVKGKMLSGALLIPDTMLKAETDLFLDGTTISALEKELSTGGKSVKVLPVRVSGEAFLKALLAVKGIEDR